LTGSNISTQPRVAILLTTHKDPPLFKDILESLKKTEYSNFEVLVVDCTSTKVKQILESATLEVPVSYFALQKDKGAAHHLNVAMQLALQCNGVKYTVRIEGDAIPLGSRWLQKLVDVMESNPEVAIAMPWDTNKEGQLGYGGRLYGNGTFCPIDPSSFKEPVPCIGTGGHCFMTRNGYLAELFKEGVRPYWDPFYVSSEDIDFGLKAWLRSYKVVTVGSARVLHEGTTGPQRAPYRVYHMYKNRLCLLSLNFGIRNILVNIWFRLLQDLISVLFHSEPILMFKAYLWVISHLGGILQQRALRMSRWKRVSDKELERHVLVRLPMPVRKARCK